MAENMLVERVFGCFCLLACALYVAIFVRFSKPINYET